MIAKAFYRRVARALAVAVVASFVTPDAWSDQSVPLPQLLLDAERANADLEVARARALAARSRIPQAGALEDPMAEVGIVNAPLAPFSLRRDDMTMKMLGVSQRLPFPGKRALRREVARGAAAVSDAEVDDLHDQVVRDVRMAYEDLAAVEAEMTIVSTMQATIAEYLTVAETRFAVGSAAQTDVLQAQVQSTRLQQQQLTLQRRRAETQAMLAQLTGREPDREAIRPMRQALGIAAKPLTVLLASSDQRPRAVTLTADSDRAHQQVLLARREFYPDFDVKLNYGRREQTPDGMPRDNMVSFTVGVTLPIWRKERQQPQLAEARAMLSEREAMRRALRLETVAQLTQRYATASQARQTVRLYDTALLPAADASVNSALAAYRVGRVDFLTLLETRMKLFEAQTERIGAVLEHNRALADLDYLSGRRPEFMEDRP